jgi:uncharacterized protein (TIGR02266 family)
MSLRTGVFRFKKHDGPMAELAGVDVRSFYSGPMATAELLLVLATAIDKKENAAPPPAKHPTQARVDERFSPTLIEAELFLGASNLSGHLTNMSAGGAFFQGDALPEHDIVAEVRFVLPGGIGLVTTKARVAWVRPDATGGERGVGLAFEQIRPEDKQRVQAYLERFQKLAADMDLVG